MEAKDREESWRISPPWLILMNTPNFLIPLKVSQCRPSTWSWHTLHFYCSGVCISNSFPSTQGQRGHARATAVFMAMWINLQYVTVTGRIVYIHPPLNLLGKKWGARGPKENVDMAMGAETWGDVEKGLQAKDCRWPTAARTGAEADSPTEAAEGTNPAHAVARGHWFWTSGLSISSFKKTKFVKLKNWQEFSI